MIGKLAGATSQAASPKPKTVGARPPQSDASLAQKLVVPVLLLALAYLVNAYFS